MSWLAWMAESAAIRSRSAPRARIRARRRPAASRRRDARARRGSCPERKSRASATSCRIGGVGHLARARPGAALDLEQEARPRAILVEGIRARPQKEGALQGVQGAVHGPDAGEGAVIIAGPIAGAAVLGDLRRHMILGDQDIGEGLVVAQQHVVARLQLLDEIGLEQERLGLRAGGDELHRGRLGDHAGDAVRMRLAARVRRDAGADVARLADIEHVAIRRDHAVDAGRIGRALQLAADDRRAGAAHAFSRGFAFGFGLRRVEQARALPRRPRARSRQGGGLHHRSWAGCRRGDGGVARAVGRLSYTISGMAPWTAEGLHRRSR